MGSRIQSHQLSNGLYVSGLPEQQKERTPTMSSVAVPYTGGDIKKSGELGKMFDIHMEGSKSKKSGPLNSAPSRTGSFGGSGSHSGPVSSAGISGSASAKRSNSGPLNRQGDAAKKSSGPQSDGGAPSARQNSGPLLPTTGLITSGPISSGPLNSSGAPRKVSGPQDSMGSLKSHSISIAQNPAVNTLNPEDNFSFKRKITKPVLWSVILIFVMGFIAGGFILVAVHNAILLVGIVAMFGFIVALLAWNTCWQRRSTFSYISRYPDSELRTAKDGQYVKITGVVTCGNFPLESSFQKVPRCVYTSTSLYEYRGWDSKAANPTHRRFTWGLRAAERYAVDFYISDFQSGLRALVKTGYSAKVTPLVDDSFVVDVNAENKDLSPEFIRWLGERNLSYDDRRMRLKEGYIKEGSTVSVMGVVQRSANNVLMIFPPPRPMTTGCQWAKCIFPSTFDGIILTCEDLSKTDVIPV